MTIKNNQKQSETIISNIFFRRHLLIFALAAPVMAIVTFLLLTLHGRENLDTFSATGTITKLISFSFLKHLNYFRKKMILFLTVLNTY